MDAQEKIMEYFKRMPKIEKVNPFWEFDRESGDIKWKKTGSAFTPKAAVPVLMAAREYFRRVYESFGTEAQVLCLEQEDAQLYANLGIPVMPGPFHIYSMDIAILVLPQFNTPVNSVINEPFWQKYIAGRDITPFARIHSHHRLDAYQSATDYSSLNSNSLEIVMGHITEEPIHIAFWLDEHGKDTKEYVFQAMETEEGQFSIRRIPSGKPQKK